MLDTYQEIAPHPFTPKKTSQPRSFNRALIGDPQPAMLCPGVESLDRSFLEGTSPIDLPRLSLTSSHQAREFLRSYGYDLNCPEERERVMEIHREAVDFTQRYLCPAPRACDAYLTIPMEVQQPRDITDLLLWASCLPRQHRLQGWSCAVLRVMHAITYANQVAVRPHSDEIRQQILEPYRAHIVYHGNNQITLGRGLDAVALSDIHFREEKARLSLIIKLLHKPDNLPQSVFDRIGIRMVTPTKKEALAALQYIHRHHLANFAHLTPGRSRNTLVENEHGPLTGAHNPHSSPHFRSIQFTCQHLVKVGNPMHGVAQQLRTRLKQAPCADLQRALDVLDPHSHEPHIRFLFPYEVQILDVENDLKTRVGESSHANYRQRQLRAVRARVLPSWLAHPPGRHSDGD